MNLEALKAARCERRAAIVAAYRTGLTQEQVGARFGVTKAAIYMVLKGEGLTKRDGGKRRRFEILQAASDEIRNAECLSRWGCTWAQFAALDGDASRPVAKYGDQRTNAKYRGIGFELTFWQWWTIWQDSGHWNERGRRGYIMCRAGDVGPYAVGNVYIATVGDNNRHFWTNRRASLLMEYAA